MDNGIIKNGTRLCYKKNENGYAWVTVTDQSNGYISYIREGNKVTVPDDVFGTRLFETLQEARGHGRILDDDYEAANAAPIEEKPVKLDYFLGETSRRTDKPFSNDLIRSIEEYIDDNLIIPATIRRLAADIGKRSEESLRKKKPDQTPEPVTHGKPDLPDHFDFSPGRSADTPSPFEELEEGDGSWDDLPFTLKPSFFRETAEPDDPILKQIKLDKSFGETLLDLIKEKGIKNSEFYYRANITKQLFYRITTQFDRPPKKNIALACTIALELDLDETKALLEKAGYALSHSNETDIIVEWFIKKKRFDIDEINSYLYMRDQELLGSDMK